MSAPRIAPRSASRSALWTVDEVREAVARRSLSLHARMRLQEAILSVALDICADTDLMPATERAWLRQALAGPVNEATEEAVRVLMQELTAVLRKAPGRVRPQIVAAPLVSRTDFE